MKKYLLLISLLVLTGCTSVGYGTANHNGKVYYFPPNCETFKFAKEDPDSLYCHHKGQYTGQIITPADRSQIEAYRIQQEANRRAWDDFNQSLKEMSPKTTNTNCYNYGYMVNCSSTTY